MKRRARELSLQQCYTALNLEQGASLEALKLAYRRRAFELHPDLHPENPQAGRAFQEVNEAYVILTRILRPEQKGAAGEEKASGGAADAGSQQQAQEAPTDAQAAQPEFDDNAQGRQRQAQDAEQRARRAGQAAYAKEEDVLRDLLNDPFARRVFEDIYAQVKDAPPSSPPPPPPQPNHGAASNAQVHAEPEWGKEHLSLDFGKGIGKAVKNWMRKQIDEEQTFYLAPAMLKPGARIRLQIRRGLSDEVSTVELKLPLDYAAGKSVRLKGMGKRIGRWQGDLYLTLVAK